MFETFWHSFFLKEVSGTEIQRKTNLGIFGYERNYKLIYPASKKRLVHEDTRTLDFLS